MILGMKRGLSQLDTGRCWPNIQEVWEEWPWKLQDWNLTSVPGEIMDKIILGVIEKHMKDTADICHSQPGFMSNLISFYDKVTHPVDQGKPVDVIFLDFHEVFDTLSQYPSGLNVQNAAG